MRYILVAKRFYNTIVQYIGPYFSKVFPAKNDIKSDVNTF